MDFANDSQTDLHMVLPMFPILDHSNKHETLWTSSTWSQVTILRGKNNTTGQSGYSTAIKGSACNEAWLLY